MNFLVLVGEGMEQVPSQKDEDDKHLKSEKKKRNVRHSLRRLHAIIEINAQVYSVLTHCICLVLSSDDYRTLMHGLIL